jgi:hypothetical protein
MNMLYKYSGSIEVLFAAVSTFLSFPQPYSLQIFFWGFLKDYIYCIYTLKQMKNYRHKLKSLLVQFTRM